MPINGTSEKTWATYICGLLIFLAICSCGRPHESEYVTVVRPFFSLLPPANYFVHDPACQRSAQPVVIRESVVWGWDEGFQVVKGFTGFQDTVVDSSLNSAIVAGTFYGSVYQRHCPPLANGTRNDRCLDQDMRIIGYDLPKTFTPLRICQDRNEYPRSSFESVALTSIHYINKAARAFFAYTGRHLEKLYLEVMPSFESIHVDAYQMGEKLVDLKYYATDNLAYTPSRRSILVYPQSQTSERLGLARYWESSFVLAHEFAHHVEGQLVGLKLKALGLKWDGSRHSYVHTNEVQEDGARHLVNFPSRAQLLRSLTMISEGFADLLAFYSEGESVNSLDGLPCLGKNRNVTQAKFGDGITPKSFNAQAYQLLLSGQRQNLACDAVDFADAHIGGAVLSQLLYRTFEIAEPSQSKSSNENIGAKYRLLLDWYQELMRLASENSSSDKIFEWHSPAIETILDRLRIEQKREVCRVHREVFPLVSPPFESHCEQSRLVVN